MMYPLDKKFVLTKDRKVLRTLLDYCEEYQVDSVKNLIDKSITLRFLADRSTKDGNNRDVVLRILDQ